ncbi:hypothetical protein CPB86DRAFT_820382 [Serendipita vermifera]|nr:hypothetical protein CPB86DRAFT_820382 [Serendipita vermifera]
MDDAIASSQTAVDLIPDGHPDKPLYLNNLGNGLHNRFKHFGALADINNAIANQQAAVDLTPPGHPNKPQRLNNLGSSLETRFKRLGNLVDIDDHCGRRVENGWFIYELHIDRYQT